MALQTFWALLGTIPLVFPKVQSLYPENGCIEVVRLKLQTKSQVIYLHNKPTRNNSVLTTLTHTQAGLHI